MVYFGESRGETHEHEHNIFFTKSFHEHCYRINLGNNEARDRPCDEEVLIMVYDADVMEEIYDDSYVDECLDDDSIDAAEAGVMHGYLGRWRQL